MVERKDHKLSDFVKLLLFFLIKSQTVIKNYDDFKMKNVQMHQNVVFTFLFKRGRVYLSKKKGTFY